MIDYHSYSFSDVCSTRHHEWRPRDKWTRILTSCPRLGLRLCLLAPEDSTSLQTFRLHAASRPTPFVLYYEAPSNGKWQIDPIRFAAPPSDRLVPRAELEGNRRRWQCR